MISRPLWATYIVTPEQKSSGILISELFEVRKWVVEKFHGISPGLLFIKIKQNGDVLEVQLGRPEQASPRKVVTEVPCVSTLASLHRVTRTTILKVCKKVN